MSGLRRPLLAALLLPLSGCNCALLDTCDEEPCASRVSTIWDGCGAVTAGMTETEARNKLSLPPNYDGMGVDGPPAVCSLNATLHILAWTGDCLPNGCHEAQGRVDSAHVECHVWITPADGRVCAVVRSGNPFMR